MKALSLECILVLLTLERKVANSLGRALPKAQVEAGQAGWTEEGWVALKARIQIALKLGHMSPKFGVMDVVSGPGTDMPRVLAEVRSGLNRWIFSHSLSGSRAWISAGVTNRARTSISIP